MRRSAVESTGPGDPVGTARQARRQQQALREILDAASEELRLHGPSGVTMRAVARRVDMTPSGLYRHVPEYELLVSPRLFDGAPERLRDAARGPFDELAGICVDAIEAGQLDPAAAGFPVATPDDVPGTASSIAMSALAALSGHLGFELRGLFAGVPMDPQQYFGGYVRATMRLMGFVVDPLPPAAADRD